jgi:predicted phage terminase large subunit-like protein
MQEGHQFRIIAVGSEQKIRGLIWNGKRPDLILCDDMENDELVMNKERREKFMRWIYGALLPVLSPSGIIRVVGTILHMDSFLESLMPKDWDKFTVRSDLKDISVDPKSGWKAVRYRAHNEDFSEILWKSRFPKEVLLAIRHDYLKRGIPDVYSQEYLNYPLDPTRAYFKRADFIDLTIQNREDIKQNKKPLVYYIAIDPAISEHERADYTALIVCGMDSDGFLYMVAALKDRIDAREQIDLIFTLYEKYEKLGGCEFIAIEKEKITQALGPFIREEMLRRQRFPQIIEIPHGNKDLEMRARSWQGRMRIGSVKFDKSAEWYPIYESEMTTFPRGVKDDYVAASAILGLALDKMIEAPTSKELADLEYEEEYKIYMGHETDGRCKSTGY